MRISAKLSLATGSIMFISCLLITILSVSIFSSGFNDFVNQTLDANTEGLALTLEDWQSSLQNVAESVSKRAEVQEIMAREDIAAINATLGGEAINSGVDIFIVTNSKGKIIAGNKGVGRDASILEVVSRSLSGDDSPLTYESESWLTYSMLCGVPCRVDGKICGAIITGYNLANDELAELVTTSYNNDFAVFQGQNCISTTLSARQRLDNDSVGKTVLQNGQILATTSRIGNETFVSRYIPLKSDRGTITGMIFMGKNLVAVHKVTGNAIKLIVPITLALLLLVLGTIIIVMRSTIKPLISVQKTLKDISAGDADLTKRINVSTNNEIGQVVKNFNQFSGKLQSIITSVKNSNNNLKEQGKNMSVISEDTSSAITEILANIDSIHSQITNQGRSVDQTAGAVNQIASNIGSLNTMIENQSEGIVDAASAVEQMIGKIAPGKRTDRFPEAAGCEPQGPGN